MRTIAFILFSLFISNAAFSQSLAEKEKTKIWQNFRENYPNPYQTIGFAQFNDKSQLYLISEPPSYIQLSDITELFEGFDYSVEVKTWNIGYDGWVKDVVICVHYIPPVYKLLFIKQLNELLYANSYRLICKELPVVQPRRIFIKANTIDYKISAMELNKWFVENNMQFVEVAKSINQYSFNELLNSPKAGVYASNDSTFIIWSIPYGNQAGFSRENIGKFTIESDIILGAISNSKTLIVIGRARQCSYAELPPLRIETIEMLAGTKNENLSQSLNIAELITGKMDNGADWCPAFVSDELENDEFGHLLTMTDIFLKDWLSAGFLSYPEYKYPKPNHYYDIKRDHIANIRYNWNTKDYIYSTRFYEKNVIAFRNTACLNASLFDASEIEEKDMNNTINSEANKYLASLNNADLARVVQYTALYQIFKTNNIHCNIYSNPHTIDKSTLLLNDTREILNKLRNLSNDEIRTISRRIEEDYFKLYLYQNLQILADTKRNEWEEEFKKAVEKAAKENNMTIKEFQTTEKYKNGREKSLQEFNRKINLWLEASKEKTINERTIEQYTEIEALRNKLYNLSYSDFNKLCNYVSYPNGEYTSDYSSIRYLSREITKLYWPIWLNAKYFGINMEKVKDDYIAALKTDNGLWMKTPKVVVTNNKVGQTKVGEDTYINVTGTVGGHSLNASIQNKPIDNTEKVRTVIGVLRTTPDEYNYANGTGNTPSSDIVHYFNYYDSNNDKAEENARAHYKAYNSSKSASQNNAENNNNQDDAVIERYMAHYEDVLKPISYQDKNANEYPASQNKTKETGNVKNLNYTEQISKEHKQKEDITKYEPFEWTQKESSKGNVIDVKTSNALVDATFYSSMATAEKKDTDKAAYYAREAAMAMSGNSGKIAINPVFSDRLTRVINEKRLIEKRISETEKDFSQKAKSARDVLASLGNNVSENTRQTLERYADRANKFLTETNSVKNIKNETDKIKKIKQLEELNNRMELHATGIREQAIKDINNCETCPAEEKEKLTKYLNIF
ncbi:MAG: hypothetical protein PHG27_04295 [Massilibacteroides sp.]|nr:hypothetical protein [Massilibacteroides sp.]MDD3063867.1 hypothetical protein [Massilibacteroides sp.]MDD4114805.1 hypothetical protein [Massilibacteroides sp.]MDD4661381.1 hypothetical protein [Massilibacteroides sp.]